MLRILMNLFESAACRTMESSFGAIVELFRKRLTAIEKRESKSSMERVRKMKARNTKEIVIQVLTVSQDRVGEKRPKWSASSSTLHPQ